MKKSPKNAPTAPEKEENGSSLARILNARTSRTTWRNAVIRVRYIHEQVRLGKYPNCSQVAKKYSVSTRTIDRDIDAMRDSMGLPLEFDFYKNGYYYTREVPHDLPRPKLSAGDTVAFSLAKRALERFRGTDFAAIFELALRKIMDEVEGEVPLEWEELDKLVSFGGPVTGKKPLPDVAGAVSEGLLLQQELRLQYRNLLEEKHEARRIRPLHLRAFGDNLLLFAVDAAKEDGVVRRFALSRMRNVRVTEERFERPDDFDADEEMRHSVGAYRGGKPEVVRLRLSALGARILDERPLHHSQKMVPLPEVAGKGAKKAAGKGRPAKESPALSVESPDYCRCAELTMKVALTPELEQTLLYWGAEMEVVGPAALRKRVRQLGEVLARRHSGRVDG